MKFDSEESMNALKYAATKEKAAEEFYTEKAQTLKVPGTGEIFKDLAKDERKHFEMVSDLLRQAESGAVTADITLPPPTNPKERVEKVLSRFRDVHLPPLSEKTVAREALTYALEIERKSFNHYSLAAEDADNSETAAVYRFLAGEENKHYNMIDNTIDFIDDPGRWLYEEENLIFRR